LKQYTVFVYADLWYYRYSNISLLTFCNDDLVDISPFLHNEIK